MLSLHEAVLLVHFVCLGAPGVANACGEGGRHVDLAPENGILSGCELERGNADVKIVSCKPSLSDDYKESLYYLLTPHIVQDHDRRVIYNKLLNTFLGNNLSICEHCDRTSYAKALEAFRSGISEADRLDFLKRIYPLKDSTVWGEGYDKVVYDILSDDFSPPQGLSLLARAVLEDATCCNPKRIREIDVVELIVHRPPEAKAAFDALAALHECRCKREAIESGWQMLAAVGLRQMGFLEKSNEMFSKLSKQAEAEGDKVLLENIRELRELTDNLPQQQEALRKALYDWFDLWGEH